MPDRPAPVDTCPCGSGGRFGACCGPLLDGELPVTAEAVMRSRYTAYVTGDVDHLMRTWHPRTRPRGLELDGTDWRGLSVLRADAGGPDDAEGIVEFEARWRPAGGRVDEVLHEVSLFARRAGRWVYVDAQG